MDSDSGMLYVVCCMCSGQSVWVGDRLVWLVLAVRGFMYRLDL